LINSELMTIDWSTFYAANDLDTAYGIFCANVRGIVQQNRPAKAAIKKKKRRRFPTGMRARYRKKKQMYRRIVTNSDKALYKKFSEECRKLVESRDIEWSLVVRELNMGH
jgi:hypothetical protein